MFSKVRNALYSVVNGIDPIPSITEGETRPDEKSPKFPYTRPHFLLFQKDEIQVSADHQIRPIIVPRDISKLPWQSGYAETVNAGKSEWNEDQACVRKNVLLRDSERHIPGAEMPYTYFALFDGHAGHGAAVAAANQLHDIVHAKLLEVFHYILPPLPNNGNSSWSDDGLMWIPVSMLTSDSFIIGALESAFNEMDRRIGEDKKRYAMNGGCTAIVALFINGKLYVANAGDSRGVRCKDGLPYPMSNDFTPTTEKKRLQQLAACKPELLMNHFTPLEYTQRLGPAELGQRIIFRDAYMSGWAYKTCSAEDLKAPVVAGEGKRSRLLATIGVTRGLGDHELCSIISKTPIKPFLSSQAEVQIFDIASAQDLTENDVLIMGTDGLWDVTNNEKTAIIVKNSLGHFPASDDSRFKYRYASAAQDLVMHSRGKPYGRNWQTADGGPATIDDISVFVIPLLPYHKEHAAWLDDYDIILKKWSQPQPHQNPGTPVTSAALSYPSIVVPTRASTIAPPTICSVENRLPTVRPAAMTVGGGVPNPPELAPNRQDAEVRSPSRDQAQVPSNVSDSDNNDSPVTPAPTEDEESSQLSSPAPALAPASSLQSGSLRLQTEVGSQSLLESTSSLLVDHNDKDSPSDLVDVQLTTDSVLLSDDDWVENGNAEQKNGAAAL